MLTHTKAKALKEPGRYGDGGGLYLVVQGRLEEMGLAHRRARAAARYRSGRLSGDLAGEGTRTGYAA